MVCDTCEKKDRTAKNIGLPCSKYPCAQVAKAETNERARIPRRGVQRTITSDFQLLGGTDPLKLAEAGAFD